MSASSSQNLRDIIERNPGLDILTLDPFDEQTWQNVVWSASNKQPEERAAILPFERAARLTPERQGVDQSAKGRGWGRGSR